MNPQLAQTVATLAEAEWSTFDTKPDGTQRQWAEVVYVPTKKSERKHSQPLRYVGLRLVQAPGVLFAEGPDRHHDAVVRTSIGVTPEESWHRRARPRRTHMVL